MIFERPGVTSRHVGAILMDVVLPQYLSSHLRFIYIAWLSDIEGDLMIIYSQIEGQWGKSDDYRWPNWGTASNQIMQFTNNTQNVDTKNDSERNRSCRSLHMHLVPGTPARPHPLLCPNYVDFAAVFAAVYCSSVLCAAIQRMRARGEPHGVIARQP